MKQHNKKSFISLLFLFILGLSSIAPVFADTMDITGTFDPIGADIILNLDNIQNGSTSVSLDAQYWNITINDVNGVFNWSIETSPYVGNASATYDSNGTKSCPLSNLMPGTNYTVFVNVTGSQVNETYWFITESFFTYSSGIFGMSVDVLPVTIQDTPTRFEYENPSNGSINQSLILTWSVNCNDTEGNTVDSMIQCLGFTDTFTTQNETLSIVISGLEYNTTYTVHCWANDTFNATYQWYTFKTMLNPVESLFGGSFGMKVYIEYYVWGNWSNWWEMDFISFGEPTNFIASSYNNNTINLSWDKNVNASHTYIRRKIGSYPTSLTDGDFVVNTTLDYHNETGLNVGTHYYYSAWGYNDTANIFTDASADDNAHTRPGDPADLVITNVTMFTISLEWQKGTNSTSSVLVMNATSIPTTPYEGIEKYNSTGNSTVVTGLTYNTTYNFSLWEYNSSSNYFSDNYLTAVNSTNDEPNVPYDLTAVRSNDTVINLAWSKTDPLDIVVVRMDTGSYPGIDNGTEIFNGTATSYQKGGLTPATPYYFTAFGWNGEVFSVNNATAFNITLPEPPQNFLGDLQASLLEVTWTKGYGADYTMIRNDTASYPDIDTGSLVYNDTGVNTTVINVTDIDFFRAWSWNATHQLWSEHTNLVWGGIEINVYKESDISVAIQDYTVFVTNQDGSETYENVSANNPFRIDVTDVPNGEDIAIQVSKDGYYTRVKYIDLFENVWYFVNFYLPPDVGGGGTPDEPDYIPPITDPDQNESYGYLYLVTVVNVYDEPIENSKLNFKRYNNVTEEYDSVSILYTDANGQVSIYLIADTLYKVEITHVAYQTEISDWIPGTEIFTHTFKMDAPIRDVDTIEDLFDGITWSMYPDQHYHNNAFQFSFTVTSSDEQLEWFRFTIERYNSSNTTWYFVNETNQSGLPGGGTIHYNITNQSARYRMSCYFKKANFSEYEVTQTGSTFFFVSIPGLLQSPIIDAIPGWIFLAILIIIMALVMAFAFPYAGIGTGYIGLAIFALGLLIKSDLVMDSTGVTGWMIFGVTALIYTVALFLWSRL